MQLENKGTKYTQISTNKSRICTAKCTQCDETQSSNDVSTCSRCEVLWDVCRAQSRFNSWGASETPRTCREAMEMSYPLSIRI